ncbi:MAG: site-specific DNA-methyltransferase [Syntrophomonadaceae bacterium]|nr:site-specific DNA-methyltransferase [Syntrophomonadaceae bacterium]
MDGVKLQWNRDYAEPIPETEFVCDELVLPAPGAGGTEPSLFVEPGTPVSVPERAYGRIIQGDALAVGHDLLRQGYGGEFRVIYLDPPYYSGRSYTSNHKTAAGDLSLEAFDDRWQQSLDRYLEMLYQRLLVMRDLLADNGSLLLHLDWHCSHYGRVLLDEVFGGKGFVNELVWCYSGGSPAKFHFQRKHDLIFWYAKGPDYVFNPQYRAYSKGTVQRGLTAVKGDRYHLKEQGAMMQDWWSDIPKILSPTAHENMKYPTQKPRRLLQRLIEASSDPGDLIGDFFAGTCTTAEACSALGRRWIMADIGPLAVQTGKYRLLRQRTEPFTVEREAGSFAPQAIAGINIDCESGFDGNRWRVSLTLRGTEGIDPQESVDYWEIDFNYNGGLFRSCRQMLRDKGRYNGELPLTAGLTLPPAGPERALTLAVRTRSFDCRCQQQLFELKA